MSNILLAYGNKATGATLSGGGWTTSGLPLNNLKDGRLAKVARSDGASVYQTQFRFDLAANYVLRALALVNHNLTTNALWRLRTTGAAMDMDFAGPTSMKPVTLTTSGGANRTRVGIYGTIEAATCPRYDFSPVNLASGTATQTISSVPAGTYLLITTGSNAAVMATGSTVSNSGTIGTTTNPSFVVVSATGNVTLTVLSAATAIHFRKCLGLLLEEARTNSVQYSDDLSNAAWITANITVTPNAYTDSGGNLLDQLDFAGGVGDALAVQPVAIPSGLANGQKYTASFRVYAAAATTVNIQFLSEPSFSEWGTEDTVVIPQGLSIVSQTVTVTGLSTDTTARIYLLTRDSVARTIYVGKVQIQQGAFATSPTISTTTSPVAATADVATITGSNFSGAHSATAGTLYAEFDVITTVAGTRPILSMDDNTANERFELYASGTDLKFKVVDGGSTVVDMTIGTIAANTFYKVAVAWAANDFAASLSGAAVVTDTSGTLPTVDRMRIGANQAGDYLNGHVRRFARWLTRRTNAELQSLATTGPDALGHDTGWQDALQMTFHGDTPANWGEQYPLIATFDAETVRYGTVEIEDTANPDNYVELGQLFVAGGFQPEHNAEYQGFGDGRTDLSSSVKSVGGQKYSTARRRPRTVDFNFPVLSPDEGDHLDEMMAEVGTTEDVLYVPDPADAAKSQRYGFLGTLRELTPLEYPFFDKRAMPLRLEQKL